MDTCKRIRRPAVIANTHGGIFCICMTMLSAIGLHTRVHVCISTLSTRWCHCRCLSGSHSTPTAVHLGLEHTSAVEEARGVKELHAVCVEHAVDNVFSGRDVNTFTVKGEDARSFFRFRERYAIHWANFH